MLPWAQRKRTIECFINNGVCKQVGASLIHSHSKQTTSAPVCSLATQEIQTFPGMGPNRIVIHFHGHQESEFCSLLPSHNSQRSSGCSPHLACTCRLISLTFSSIEMKLEKGSSSQCFSKNRELVHVDAMMTAEPNMIHVPPSSSLQTFRTNNPDQHLSDFLLGKDQTLLLFQDD